MELNNRTAQIMLIVLLFLWVSGLFIVPGLFDSVVSYLIGSVLVYLMANLVYTKLKNEAEQLKGL